MGHTSDTTDPPPRARPRPREPRGPREISARRASLESPGSTGLSGSPGSSGWTGSPGSSGPHRTRSVGQLATIVASLPHGGLIGLAGIAGIVGIAGIAGVGKFIETSGPVGIDARTGHRIRAESQNPGIFIPT
eukprot:scaffold36298_cov122-Isochrysis_galbana.AAC.8